MVETFIFHFFYITDFYLHYLRASLLAQMVKNTSAVRETSVGSQTWEDPLEKGTITHSSILAWRIPKKKKNNPPLSEGDASRVWSLVRELRSYMFWGN